MGGEWNDGYGIVPGDKVKASFAVGVMDQRGQISYRYTVGNESHFASNYNADVESAMDLFEGMYPDAGTLREFLYAPHARRQAETAQDIPAYIGAAVRESPCKVALLHTDKGYVGWDVRGERARRWQERCVLLLAQARGMLRDARGALRDGDPGQAGRLRENARRTSETAQTTVGDAQELVVEAGFGFGDITLLWQAQMVLERAAMRHLSRTLDRDIGEALQLIELGAGRAARTSRQKHVRRTVAAGIDGVALSRGRDTGGAGHGSRADRQGGIRGRSSAGYSCRE